MVRMKDIAQECGVSVATVSRALNGVSTISREQTELITRTAKEMGYYPNAAARTLKTRCSNNIGILYEDRMAHSCRLYGAVSVLKVIIIFVTMKKDASSITHWENG